MKSSIVVSTSKTQFKALAYQENLEENLRKTASLGFDGVELAVRNPIDIDLPHLKQALKDSGLMVSAIGTGQAHGEDGLSLTSPSSKIRQSAIQRIKSHIDFAAEIGNPIIIIGLIRGTFSKDMEQGTTWDLALSAVRECAVYAKRTCCLWTA